MSTLSFYKMSGSGNDFVFLDGRSAGPLDDWTPHRIAAICARRTGVGADGFVVLAPQTSDRANAAVRFNYFNADGGRSDMCGNASLCATRLAAKLGMAPATGMTLVTDVGPIEAKCLAGPGERAQICLPDVDAPTTPDIPLTSGERVMLQYLVGIPHVVILVDDVDATTAYPLDRGKFIRHHEGVGRAGANANFVSQTADGTWCYRTFERGVEDETLACGTGAVAVAAALKHVDVCQDGPIRLLTSSQRIVEVNGVFQPNGAVDRPTLAGEGRLVFVGQLEDQQ